MIAKKIINANNARSADIITFAVMPINQDLISFQHKFVWVLSVVELIVCLKMNLT